MIRKKLRFGRGFRVIPGNRFSQAAEMVLESGGSEGDSGTGRNLLRTLNSYAPLPRGKK